jgi:hypothetical protein
VRRALSSEKDVRIIYNCRRERESALPAVALCRAGGSELHWRVGVGFRDEEEIEENTKSRSGCLSLLTKRSERLFCKIMAPLKESIRLMGRAGVRETVCPFSSCQPRSTAADCAANDEI